MWNGARRRSATAVHRPDVTSVSVDVVVDVLAPLALVLEQQLDLEASSLRCLECRDGGGQAGVGRCADRRVLALDQFDGLRRPRHQLAVEHEPVGAQLAPQLGGVGGLADAAERRLGLLAVVEERPAGSGVDRARLAAVDAEALAGDVGVAADDDDRARAHVLLLADHVRDAVGSVFSERALRVLEQVGPRRGGGGRHRRRQVDEPPRIDREAAHHLQRGGGVLLPDGDRARQARLR